MKHVFAVLMLVLFAGPVAAQETKGRVLDPSPANLKLTWDNAQVTLPARMTGGAGWSGKMTDLPSVVGGPTALVIFMHGSSGVADFVKQYQAWLADSLGLASIAPNSMAIPDRLTYTSPIAVDLYEQVHALRQGELDFALAQARQLPWVDSNRIGVIGTSEGSVPVARSTDSKIALRILYAWSCERNYFVKEPLTAVPIETPVLNVIATRDPYFSPDNPWNQGYGVTGDCGRALRDHKNAAIYKPVTDKHTVVNQPDVRAISAYFLQRLAAR